MGQSVKQVIVMRTDLNMRKGKMIAQGAHASLGVVLDMMSVQSSGRDSNMTLELKNGTPLQEWVMGHFTKICVYVNSEEELLAIYNKAKEKKIPSYMVTDAGYTELPPNTRTCCAIGPDWAGHIDEITGNLKLL